MQTQPNMNCERRVEVEKLFIFSQYYKMFEGWRGGVGGWKKRWECVTIFFTIENNLVKFFATSATSFLSLSGCAFLLVLHERIQVVLTFWEIRGDINFLARLFFIHSGSAWGRVENYLWMFSAADITSGCCLSLL